jgi:oligopeptide/dipeptide ABC transporter ATP-binding protein
MSREKAKVTSAGPDASSVPLLEVKDIKKHYPVRGVAPSRSGGMVLAVDGVSFTVKRGETFGLVGESGCGKTTIGRTILRLMPATSGEVLFEGKNVFSVPRREMQRLRRQMQIVFQDPYASLNTRLNVKQILTEPFVIHGVGNRRERQERVQALLRVVGLQSSDSERFPHEFSGGQRQRIGIARALALNPKLVICDEPVSALDVSIQSQILNLLTDLQGEFGLTYVFIAHGLHVIKHVSQRVGVMYLGKLVEVAATRDLFASPIHPYTSALLSAIPVPDPGHRSERIILEGDVPSPARPPSGCRFHPRCRMRSERCKMEEPLLRDVGSGRQVACFLS